MTILRAQGFSLDEIGARTKKMDRQNVWRSLVKFERFAAQKGKI